MPNHDLTFKAVSAVNRSRCQRWHPGFPGGDGWTGADWANAMQGEAGEAGNVVKKLRRIETGMLSARADGARSELFQKLADEIGDVYAYLDLLAQFYGLNIEDCIRDKFNAVSVREGMPERIADPSDLPDKFCSDELQPRHDVGSHPADCATCSQVTTAFRPYLTTSDHPGEPCNEACDERGGAR